MSATDEHGRVWVSVAREVADNHRPINMGTEVVLGSLTLGAVTAVDSRGDEIWVAISPDYGVEFGEAR